MLFHYVESKQCKYVSIRLCIFARSMCVKDQIGAYLPQIMQLESGLMACGLMADMKNSPEIWRSLFESGNMFQVSAQELLNDMIINYSTSQLLKEKEIDTYKSFSDVLEAIGAGGK